MLHSAAKLYVLQQPGLISNPNKLRRGLMKRGILVVLSLMVCALFCIPDYVEAANYSPLKYEYTHEKYGTSFLDGKFTFGGRFRIRQEYLSNYSIPDKQVDDDLTLFQTRLYFDVKPLSGLGFFFMLEDARDLSEPHPYKALVPYAYDTALDIQQAYIYYEPEKAPYSVWAGRREINYLKHRLIGTTLGWGNKVIAYDGFLTNYKNDQFSMDLAYLNRVAPDQGRDTFKHAWFASPSDTFVAWLTLKKINPYGKVDVYAIVDSKDNDVDIDTYGLRLYGAIGSLHYDIDGNLQRGNALVNGELQDREAAACYLDVWYAFDGDLKPTLGVEYFMATGDSDPSGGKYKTFDQLYATPHYSYGYMDLFGWQNMHDLNFKASINPLKDIKLGASFHSFWLYAKEDSWYNAYKGVQRKGNPHADNFVGNEADLICYYDFLEHWQLIATYGHFFPGGFVEDTGPSKDGDFFSADLRFEF